MFSAALRMAAHIPRKVRVAFVEEVRAALCLNRQPCVLGPAGAVMLRFGSPLHKHAAPHQKYC
jgi:hypothetical protein